MVGEKVIRNKNIRSWCGIFDSKRRKKYNKMTIWEAEDQNHGFRQLGHIEAASEDEFHVKIPGWFQGQNSISF